MMQDRKKSLVVATALVVLGAFTRLIDHLPNFSPMEAIALFGGAYLTSKFAAYLVPIVAIYLSDLVLNNTIMRPFFANHEGIVLFDGYMIYNIVGMLAIVAIARVLLKRVSPTKVIGSSIIASAVFFVVTNIGSWLTLPIYTKDIAGLVTAMTAGIPFFNTSWISSLIFTIVLFGSYQLYLRYQTGKLALATKEA